MECRNADWSEEGKDLIDCEENIDFDVTAVIHDSHDMIDDNSSEIDLTDCAYVNTNGILDLSTAKLSAFSHSKELPFAAVDKVVYILVHYISSYFTL